MLSSEDLNVANALLMRMYEEMGTQLALQYGGSQAVGTPNSNAARDFLQSVKVRLGCDQASLERGSKFSFQRLGPVVCLALLIFRSPGPPAVLSQHLYRS